MRSLGDPVHGHQVASEREAERVGLPQQPEEVLAARCPSCGYTYDVARGDEHEGFAAGTAWADVPESWCCPDCGVREKVDFVPVASELESAS